MNTGEGEHSRALVGWIGMLLLAWAGFVSHAQVMAAGVVESTSDSITPAVQFHVANAGLAKVPTLRRLMVAPFLPSSQFAFAYSQPLVSNLIYSPTHAGMTGKILLPGQRQFRSELEFELILQGESRALTPDAPGVSLTVLVGPGWMAEEWVWQDGLSLRRTCFQPTQGMAVGQRFLVRNRTAHALSGVRIMARLKNPEIIGDAAKSVRYATDDIIADPRNEILYIHDQQTYEESWMALGWGPQGGFMSGGDYDQGVRSSHARDLLDVTVRMETPACDLFPGQNQEAFFWTVWGFEQEQVVRDMSRLRQAAGFASWEQSNRQLYTQGIQMDCRDPYLTFLFYNCKAWARWLTRRDSTGTIFVFSPGETEPVVPELLQVGGAGFLALGETREFRQQLENWMDQKYETSDAIYMLLAFSKYYQWTHDHRWLVDNQMRVEEMLSTIAELDTNGDGLPEVRDSVFSRETYRTDMDGGRMRVRTAPAQYVQVSAAAIGALRHGAWLLKQIGNENRLNAARYASMADVGSRTLDDYFWNGELGKHGFYSSVRLPESGSIDGHRQAGVLEVVKQHLSTPEKSQKVWGELWDRPSWRTPEEALRSMPSDDPDFCGDRIRNRGNATLSRTHELFQWGLTEPDTATYVLERVLRYARYRAQDPRFLGGLVENTTLAGTVDFQMLNWVELTLRALTGIDVCQEGLRIYVPLYRQDLGIRIRQLNYRGTQVDVEVQGQGTRGRIWVNGQEWEAGKCLTESILSRKTVKIRIHREP